MKRMIYKTAKKAFYRLSLFMAITTLIFGSQGILAPKVQAQGQSAPLASTNFLTLDVVSARTEPRAFGGSGVSQGDAISEFQYIINIDNTGTTEQRSPSDGCSPADPGYPASCNWTSIAGLPSYSPIYTQGNQDDFAGPGLELPPGRYLISVIADGYRLDGEHFTVPLPDPGTLKVELQPFPLPDATIRARIFEDNAPANSAPDMPAEQGLAGFVGHITDYIDAVSTDVYGNPLCTVYEGEDLVTHEIPFSSLDGDMLPVPIPGTGGQCVSDANGDLVIPHLGPGRYGLSAVRPAGSDWVQTTTLEGNHEWDAWVMEGATGFDTEFVVAGEPFPATFFGFVHGNPGAYSMGAGSGVIQGVIMAAKVYIPAQGGVSLPGQIWGGLSGMKLDKPIQEPWIALNDLNNGDTTVYVGQGNADGSFSIPNVPDGTYTLSYWDEPQDYIFDFVQVTVSNGEVVDLGVLPLTGWWTSIEGHVFNDLNENGKMDAGEPGIANFPVVMKKRENSVMDRGAKVVTTDASGYYWMENAYPMTQWLIMEAYADNLHTTGVTYQADNQPTETTILGAGVDINVLPIIGLGGRLDWGVKAYAPGTNGGIVGSISYDTTRNELDPSYAAVEDWQPGIPNLTVNLYAPVACPFDNVTPCDPLDFYALNADGSYMQGQLLNQYLTETWEQPTGCVARDLNGDPLVHGTSEDVLPLDPDALCLEGPLMGVQFAPMASDVGTPAENFGATVDGNYGFGDGCFGPGGFDANTGSCVSGDFSPLTVGDYLVEVEIPNDALGRPLYKVTREEDINIGNGDQFIPQIPPPACAGALHIVDVANVGADSYPAMNGSGYDVNGLPVGVSVNPSTPTVNATFADLGGTPQFEGQPKPLCDMKLVRVSDQRSVAPGFNLFTDIPIPVRFWGLLVDDLNFSSNPQSLLYGEKAGVAFAPVGIYDFANRLITTVESDYNGIYDVLLPSTNRINCPTPSGVCANMYRFVGNDPGIPGRWNPNYNPQFRTISAEFEAFPGLIVPTDLAPTQVGVTVQLPGGQTAPVACTLDDVTPQLFAVNNPYVNTTGGVSQNFTITGNGFGASQGSGQVTLDGTTVLPVTSWSNTNIAVTVPGNTPSGPHQLAIKAGNGQKTVNGLTFHVLNSGSSGGAFPATAVLDNFNRSDGALGANWTGLGAASTSLFRIQSQQVQVRSSGSYILWNGSPSSFGADQEAYFTFKTPLLTSSLPQALVLKATGSSALLPGTSYIDVRYNAQAHTVTVETIAPNPQGYRLRTTIGSVTFANNDVFGARALADGTVNVYKNGTVIGSTNITSGAFPWPGAAGGGRIGALITPNVFPFGPQSQVQFDNFGGGTYAASSVATYLPNLYEVGPGKPYAAIQSALDAAAASNGDDLVVVYPGAPDLTNPRYNGRGAYYENLIIYSPVKLQGVGPGGVYSNGTPVPGSIIDGIAYGGDTNLADAWRAKMADLSWDGNQDTYEGSVITVLASENQTTGANQARQFTANFKASIDGFDLRGGNQMDFPNNINEIGGAPTGLPPNVEIQGGAIFANAYVRHLQVTNNVVENNGGSYGTIRIGTPNLPAPGTDQQNDNLRIANNRIFANAGTNLAGAIGLFNGSENYEVAYNDLCGNFSAEYGGGISHYGLSPNGKIHDNRIYFNRSYDEGAGIFIAGELPVDPLANYGTPNGPQGSGPVDVYNNLIQANLANDDGGGLRFLMVGNFPMNVYNNMIVNNISTHEGGGVALDDTPNVRFYNNTVMKSITTSTAVTSLGSPVPSGLSTGSNSAQLQATLPSGSALFSDPLLFNNIFWDNRSGTVGLGLVTGIGAPGDATPIDYWDIGAADGSGLLAPTNSILQQTAHPFTPSGSNLFGQDPTVLTAFDVGVTFSPWRTNPNFLGAIMITANLPPNLLGDYHIPASSPAINTGAANKSSLNAPAFDFDFEARPGNTLFDIGADEIGGGPYGGGGGGPTPPPVAFPTTSVIDLFNRPNGSINSGPGSNWSGDLSQSIFRIQSNVVQVRQSGSLYWNQVSFGANQEAFFTFTDIGNGSEQGLLLKFNGSSFSSSNARYIEVAYNPSSNSVRVWTKRNGQSRVLKATFTGITFANGDVFGAKALSDGTVLIYKNGVQVATLNVTSGSNPWPTSLVQGGGRIGVRFNGGSFSGSGDARFDDFGGGTVP